ncbi:hypothetical protein BGW38_006736, partial [Lunasporangiospora selenospora]
MDPSAPNPAAHTTLTASSPTNSSNVAAGTHSISAAQPQGNAASAASAAGRGEQRKAKAVSDAIDRALRADKERMQKERGAKLLIL